MRCGQAESDAVTFTALPTPSWSRSTAAWTGFADRIAGDVVETPISPKDVLATTYHLLGIDPTTVLQDRLGRPLPVAGEGKVRTELLA